MIKPGCIHCSSIHSEMTHKQNAYPFPLARPRPNPQIAKNEEHNIFVLLMGIIVIFLIITIITSQLLWV